MESSELSPPNSLRKNPRLDGEIIQLIRKYGDEDSKSMRLSSLTRRLSQGTASEMFGEEAMMSEDNIIDKYLKNHPRFIVLPGENKIRIKRIKPPPPPKANRPLKKTFASMNTLPSRKKKIHKKGRGKDATQSTHSLLVGKRKKRAPPPPFTSRMKRKESGAEIDGAFDRKTSFLGKSVLGDTLSSADPLLMSSESAFHQLEFEKIDIGGDLKSLEDEEEENVKPTHPDHNYVVKSFRINRNRNSVDRGIKCVAKGEFTAWSPKFYRQFLSKSKPNQLFLWKRKEPSIFPFTLSFFSEMQLVERPLIDVSKFIRNDGLCLMQFNYSDDTFVAFKFEHQYDYEIFTRYIKLRDLALSKYESSKKKKNAKNVIHRKSKSAYTQFNQSSERNKRKKAINDPTNPLFQTVNVIQENRKSFSYENEIVEGNVEFVNDDRTRNRESSSSRKSGIRKILNMLSSRSASEQESEDNIDTDGDFVIVPDLNKAIGGVFGSNSENNDLGDLFGSADDPMIFLNTQLHWYHHKADLWTLDDLISWLEHIPVIDQSSQSSQSSPSFSFSSISAPPSSTEGMGEGIGNDFDDVADHGNNNNNNDGPPAQVISAWKSIRNVGVEDILFDYISENIPDGKPYRYLKVEIDLYLQTGEPITPLLIDFFCPEMDHVVRRIHRYMQLIDKEFYSTKYDMTFHIVLQKLIKQALKNNPRCFNDEISIEDLEDDLLGEKRSLWRVQDLQDTFIFNLLFGMDFMMYSERMSNNFQKFEQRIITKFEKEQKKKEEEEEETEGETDEDDEVSKSSKKSINKQKKQKKKINFFKILERYNGLYYGCNMEYIIFGLYVRYKRLTTQKEVNLIEEKILKKAKRITTFVKRIAHEQSIIASYAHKRRSKPTNSSEEIEEMKILEQHQKKIEKYDKQIQELEDSLAYLNGEKRLKKKWVTGKYDPKTRKEIMEIRREFLMDPKRRDNIRKLISRRIDDLSNSSSNSSDPIRKKKETEEESDDIVMNNHSKIVAPRIKLCISKSNQRKVSSIEKVFSKILDDIFKPSFFSLGWTHGYVLFGSVGLHYFSNGIVTVSDLERMREVMKEYEDLIVLDVTTPFLHFNFSNNENNDDEDNQSSEKSEIYNGYEKLIDLIRKLSVKIIFWNTNYHYEFIHFGRKKKGKGRGGSSTSQTYVANCQEFTMEILKNPLNVPLPFYPEIQHYLTEIKTLKGKKCKLVYFYEEKNDSDNDSESEDEEEEEEKEEEEIRIIHRFLTVSKTNFSKEFVRDVCGGQKIVYFTTHSELDEFVRKCLEKEENFQYDFPGVWQLLKGFDRSFWTTRHYTLFHNPINDPSWKGCPFINDDD